jgi:hypothetical protein
VRDVGLPADFSDRIHTVSQFLINTADRTLKVRIGPAALQRLQSWA